MSDNVNDWYKRYEAQQKIAHESATARLRDLAPRLAKFGVEKLVAAYDGSGDSGDFEDISLEPESLKLDDVLLAVGISRDALADMLWPLLPCGWEINEGSYGELTLDAKTGKIHRVHNERIEEINTTEEEF